jgi:hypothetical protein
MENFKTKFKIKNFKIKNFKIKNFKIKIWKLLKNFCESFHGKFQNKIQNKKFQNKKFQNKKFQNKKFQNKNLKNFEKVLWKFSWKISKQNSK